MMPECIHLHIEWFPSLGLEFDDTQERDGPVYSVGFLAAFVFDGPSERDPSLCVELLSFRAELSCLKLHLLERCVVSIRNGRNDGMGFWKGYFPTASRGR